MYIRAGVVVGVLAGVLAPTDSFKQAGLLLRGNVCLQPLRAYRFLQMCTHTDMNTAVQSADHFEEFALWKLSQPTRCTCVSRLLCVALHHRSSYD